MLKEFKQFLLRGNVTDLAVGVVFGAAFGNLIKDFVSDLVTPLIAIVLEVPDFNGLAFTIYGSKFMFGHFLNTLASFVLIAFVLFFLIIKPINLIISRSHRGTTVDPTTKKCPECLSEIPLNAKRCAHCAERVE